MDQCANNMRTAAKYHCAQLPPLTCGGRELQEVVHRQHEKTLIVLVLGSFLRDCYHLSFHTLQLGDHRLGF